MLKSQQAIAIPDTALRQAMAWASWPARLQRLVAGPLVESLPPGSTLIVDGGHNPSAGRAIAAHAAALAGPITFVLGMLASKDHEAFLKALPADARRIGVPVAGHAHVPPALLAAETAPDLPAALARVDRPATVIVCGSLHLAGELLRLNGPLPA
jgi:dihydrofolate synthase/folylpolyglutamate synthase